METISTDVLIIGAGAAGIRAAEAACKAGVSVVMLTKGKPTCSGTTFSSVSKGWGMQALTGEERTTENIENFHNDIIRVGLGRCDPELARILAEESGARLEELISWGLKFKKKKDGAFLRAKGCFSSVERAFITENFQNLKKSFLSILNHLTVKIITGRGLDLMAEDGICHGAWALAPSGDMLQINAKTTILATGGGGGVYRRHLVGPNETGDGYVLADRAGAWMSNMAFVQFMLGLKRGNQCKFLPLAKLGIPNKVLNSQGVDLFETLKSASSPKDMIRLRQNHYPFSCRDFAHNIDIAVARSVNSGHPMRWREDSGNEDWEVHHLAQAFNGGVKIDQRAETTISGLFAAGETAAGPHGADRIGGCMMTATQVFGERAGRFGAEHARNQYGTAPDVRFPKEYDRLAIIRNKKSASISSAIENDVKNAMTRYAMIVRTLEGLRKCRSVLDECENRLHRQKANKRLFIGDYINTRSIIHTSRLIVECALNKRESLGAHFREDFPPVPVS